MECDSIRRGFFPTFLRFGFVLVQVCKGNLKRSRRSNLPTRRFFLNYFLLVFYYVKSSILRSVTLCHVTEPQLFMGREIKKKNTMMMVILLAHDRFFVVFCAHPCSFRFCFIVSTTQDGRSGSFSGIRRNSRGNGPNEDR